MPLLSQDINFGELLASFEVSNSLRIMIDNPKHIFTGGKKKKKKNRIITFRERMKTDQNKSESGQK